MVDLGDTTVIAALLVFLAVGLGTLALALLLEYFQERRRQLAALRQLQQTGGPDATVGGLLRTTEGEEVPAWLRPVAQRVPAYQNLESRMEQAGLKGRLPFLLGLSVGLGMLFGTAVLLVTRVMPAAILSAMVGSAVPYLIVSWRRRRRLDAFEERLPEAIDLLARAIRAGHPITSGFKMVADESPEPLQGEFRRAHEENRFGLPFEDAMYAMAERVGLVDVRILVTAILIQREVGGNLAEVLDNLAGVIRTRFTIRRQIRVYTAQGRLSGLVLAGLPIIVGCAVWFMNPGYVGLLFSDPLGKLMLGTAVVFQIIGFFWIRRITDIEI